MFVRLKKESALELLRFPIVPIYTPVPRPNGNGTDFKRTYSASLADYFLGDDSLDILKKSFGYDQIARLAQCLEEMTEPDYIREWYKKAYPYDPLGNLISESITFSEMLSEMIALKDPYKILDVGDSAIRGRVFAELSVRSGISLQDLHGIYMLSA